MKQDNNQIIAQALRQAFLEDQADAPQEQPALSPDFRNRMMALNRQYLYQQARCKTALRRWACAAAAMVVLCTAVLTGAYHWVQRQNRPETMYTIRQLPEDFTQSFRKTSPHASCTTWESDRGSIVLMQEEHSLESLMQYQTHLYDQQREIHTGTLDGRLYINTTDACMTLVWQNGKYSLLLMMDGTTDLDRLIRTAENLEIV